MRVVMYNLFSYSEWKVNDERDSHDFGEDVDRMAPPAKFASCVAVVRGNDEDAIVIEPLCLQVCKEGPQALVDFVEFKSYAVIESFSVMPVSGCHSRHVVAGELMHVHGLRVEDHRTVSVGTRVQSALKLLNCRTDLEAVPK